MTGKNAGNDWTSITDYNAYVTEVLNYLKSWAKYGGYGLDGVDLDYEVKPISSGMLIPSIG